MPESKDKKTGPSSAPEVDPTLLTLMQKKRIEAEFGPPPADDASSAAVLPTTAPPLKAGRKRQATAAAPDPAPAAKTPPLAADMAAASADLKEETDAESGAEPQEPTPPPIAKKHRFRAFVGRHKKMTVFLLLLAVLGGLAAVPQSRYVIAGFAFTQPYTITVTDAVTKRPVSSATIDFAGQRMMTDKDGKLTLDDVQPGPHQLSVSKKYYRQATARVVVPLYGKDGNAQVSITATGRQVPLTVTNKITGKPMEDVSLKSVGTEVKTDKDGKAVIVLPADKPSLEITLAANGYNPLVTRITVTDQPDEDNEFKLVPSGRVYFLSRQSGKLDVVKTHLDGSDRQTVVYGTGKEDDRSTVLLASRDWKYLALYSKRDSDSAKLFLIDTASDKLTVMDESQGNFTPIGWSDHTFAYSATRTDNKLWQPGYQAVKSYNADRRQMLTVDQTQGEGDQGNNKFQQFLQPYLVGDKLVYAVTWASFSGNDLADRTDAIRATAVGTQSKKDIRTFPSVQYGSIEGRVYEPGSVYYAAYSMVDNKYDFYEYEASQVKEANVDQEQFFATNYPTYLVSPSGAQTFWSEQRDGRETFFVGDAAAKNAKNVGVIEDGAVFGWYGNDYVLTSKKGSELYIMPVSGGTPLKVSDYHKPQVSYRGYGGGYGGL